MSRLLDVWSRRRRLGLLGATAALVALAAQLGPPWPGARVAASVPVGTPPGYTVAGIDVSAYQGTVDWPAVKASGVTFAYVRATEQASTPDQYFTANYLAAKAQGLFVGAYHRARPDASSGKAQADYFLDHAQFSNDGTTLPPAVDMEWPRAGWTDPRGEPLDSCYDVTPAQIVGWTRAFLDEVATRTGRLGTVYTSASWWNLCTDSSTAFGPDPLWLARYSTSPLPLPAGWAAFTFWQFSSTGSLANGQLVDQDVFNGDLAALASLAQGTPTRLTSWVDPRYQHVAYLPANRHVHELYARLTDGGWRENDLTTAARGPAALSGSALSSWVDASYQHLAYVSSDGHVHELYFRLSGGRWASTDLTTAARAPAPLPGSALSSWVDAKYQHLAYVSSDGHIRELYHRLSGGRWASTDLTTAARAPAPLVGSALSSWVDPTAAHVVYLSADAHVRELYFRFSGGGWRASDLTRAARAPAALFGSALTSWVIPASQQVSYIAIDGHVHQLYLRFSGGGWRQRDLQTPAAAAASPSPGSAG